MTKSAAVQRAREVSVQQACDIAEQQSKDAHFIALVRPIASPRYEVDVHWNSLVKLLNDFGEDYGGLELNPDFQRGHVWTPVQQTHFIENVMRGVVATSGLTVQFNCANFDTLGDGSSELPKGLQCIDGLQRLTAVTQFMAGEVRPFGLAVKDFSGTRFDATRMTYRLKLAIFNFQRKAEVLDHYLAINAGGTPHSVTEIARVRAMRAQLGA